MELQSFSWERLGNIHAGRASLGIEMPVAIYRLMQFTMLDVLTVQYGEAQANRHFYEAGYLAGQAFAQNVLNLNQDFDSFVSELHTVLLKLKIGIFRMEEFNPETGAFTLSIGEDLDCSGLPISGDTVCHYDEGFLAGILDSYTGKKYLVKEIDCWANGNRTCRFRGTVMSEDAPAAPAPQPPAQFEYTPGVGAPGAPSSYSEPLPAGQPVPAVQPYQQPVQPAPAAQQETPKKGFFGRLFGDK